ncbi:MAG TPA: hypothetical protein VFQ61_33390, partial [Polyangiaceae bacterium]|nr:hypothetical protein [Polyangiaceae bacterium]
VHATCRAQNTADLKFQHRQRGKVSQYPGRDRRRPWQIAAANASLRLLSKPKDVDLDDSAWLETQSSPSAWRDASRRSERAGRPMPGSARASPLSQNHLRAAAAFAAPSAQKRRQPGGSPKRLISGTP